MPSTTAVYPEINKKVSDLRAGSLRRQIPCRQVTEEQCHLCSERTEKGMINSACREDFAKEELFLLGLVRL